MLVPVLLVLHFLFPTLWSTLIPFQQPSLSNPSGGWRVGGSHQWQGNAPQWGPQHGSEEEEDDDEPPEVWVEGADAPAKFRMS